MVGRLCCLKSSLEDKKNKKDEIDVILGSLLLWTGENFAERVRRRKVVLGFVLWICLPSVERDVFGTGAAEYLFEK